MRFNRNTGGCAADGAESRLTSWRSLDLQRTDRELREDNDFDIMDNMRHL